jgi:glycosyltransferase involved in cell wall biosynthesis
MSEKKIKVLTISDHPLLPSGVGIQTKQVIQALLETGRYEVVSLGGAIQHPDYTPTRTQEWGDKWTIYPVDGYGDQNMIRSFIHGMKPDIIYFMTDPRFYEWLWDIEDEIRPYTPLVYYHVWDNYPYPTYNSKWYNSTDVVASISKVTSDIVQTVSPEVEEAYIPHAVDTEIFRRYEKDDHESRERVKVKLGEINNNGRFLFFWNNRNARRKQSGSLLFWFKDFLDKVGHDKAQLLMHTDLNDPNGQPLGQLANHLGLIDGQVVFSTQKVDPLHMADFYNMADCTLNISDAEGFGLATLESLSCSTPIIVNMTGGLQEQVTDGENWFGIGIKPASSSVIGSLTVPWIHEDRVSKEDFIDSLTKMMEMKKKEREKLGDLGREHVMKNYSFDVFNKSWVSLMDSTYENRGSWENRKMYTRWECEEI